MGAGLPVLFLHLGAVLFAHRQRRVDRRRRADGGGAVLFAQGVHRLVQLALPFPAAAGKEGELLLPLPDQPGEGDAQQPQRPAVPQLVKELAAGGVDLGGDVGGGGKGALVAVVPEVRIPHRHRHAAGPLFVPAHPGGEL